MRLMIRSGTINYHFYITILFAFLLSVIQGSQVRSD